MAAPAPKHILENKWSLWHTPGDISKEMIQKHGDYWKAATALTKAVETFGSVEEFWAIARALPPCTKLGANTSLMFYREGTKPFWEDAAFRSGGRWKIQLDPVPTAEQFIQSLLLHVLGEQLSVDLNAAKIVGGVRYKRREKMRDQFIDVEVWLTDAEKGEEIKAYCVKIAERVGITNLTSNAALLEWKKF